MATSDLDQRGGEALNTRTITTPGEAITIVLVCFGWPIYASMYSVLGGFQASSLDAGGIWDLILTELFLAAIAVYVLKARNFDTEPMDRMMSGAPIGAGSGHAGHRQWNP